ncbi:MAG: hypothetical protein ACKOKE_07370, partial [Actinomycetota bacterium]
MSATAPGSSSAGSIGSGLLEVRRGVGELRAELRDAARVVQGAAADLRRLARRQVERRAARPATAVVRDELLPVADDG